MNYLILESLRNGFCGKYHDLLPFIIIGRVAGACGMYLFLYIVYVIYFIITLFI